MAGPHSFDRKIGILIIDDDEHGRAALSHVLGSEGWDVHVTPLGSLALSELARREWTLIVANVSLTGLEGALFETLKVLSHSLAMEGDTRRVRALFLVPELLALDACPVLNQEQLPYALKPINLHDFLEKVSDLLLEAGAIAQPIRRIRFDARPTDTSRPRKSAPSREKPMFASREDYAMTEEEIAEFERGDLELKREEARRREELKKQLGEPPR